MANVSSSNGLEKRPKLRFPGFDEPWEHKELLYYLVENTDRNKQLKFGKENVLSVSGEYGIVNQIAFQGRSFAGESVADYHVVETDDIVYTKSPLKANPYGIIKVNNGVPGIVSTLYAVYHPLKTVVPRFVDFYFSNDLRLNKFLKPLVNIGAKHDMKVNNTFVLTGMVVFPPLREQQKIVDFLTILDRRIDVQRKKVEALKKYKRGLLSQLIAQKKAFDTSGEWKTVKLGHIFKERTERAKGNETLLAVTISNGVQRRDEIDLKDNSSDDKSNYKCVYIGDIAYNTMRMWQGASGVSPYNGIVSPAYTIVTPIRPDLHNMTFWAYYFKYSPLVQTFQKYSQGLTSDTWNLKFPQFSEIAVTMPPISEQDKIAECLSVFDEHCKCEDEKLQALLQVRTSLLQQLFI